MAKLKRATASIDANANPSVQIDWDAFALPMLYFRGADQEILTNQAFQRIYGQGKVQIAPPRSGNVIPLKSRPLTENLLKNPGRHEAVDLNVGNGTRCVDIEVIESTHEPSQTFGIIYDLEEKRKLERELIESHMELTKLHEVLVQSSKLSQLGELSTGIAHELNQPLQAILGYSQELKHIGMAAEQSQEFLEEIERAAKKMSEISNSLRAFARKSSDAAIETSVIQVAQDAIKMTRHSLLESNVDVQFYPPAHQLFFKANPTQLEQVIVNFMTNARDAIVSTGRRGLITVRFREHDEAFFLEIQDNGCGMDEETKAKIFDPFFTTKPVGKGTGLGLNISFGICQKFGIRIEVESELKLGTVFRLRFPKDKTKQ